MAKVYEAELNQSSATPSNPNSSEKRLSHQNEGLAMRQDFQDVTSFEINDREELSDKPEPEQEKDKKFDIIDGIDTELRAQFEVASEILPFSGKV